MVPTDGSTLSARALPVAESIARAQEAEVILVRVMEPVDRYGLSVESYLTVDAYDELIESRHLQAEADLLEMIEAIEGRGSVASSMILVGSPADQLLSAEADLRPDLVVMGSHGRSGVARLALGSVAERLVREGAAPVLVVHAATPIDRALHIALVPVDGSARAEAALAMVESLAGAPIRGVRLLRVLAEGEQGPEVREYLRNAAVRLRARGLVVSSEIQVGNAAEVIQNAAKEVDLVILATHGRGGLDRLRNGSIAEEVTRAVTAPVLLVRAMSRVAAMAPLVATGAT
jgi:nucleotide-binding universal stress UspA family protein